MRIPPLKIVLLSATLSLLSCSRSGVPTWMMTELRFESSTEYTSADTVWMDVTFTHQRSGESLTRPAFWDGNNSFIIRFAPTREGRWKWESSCPSDKSLDGLAGGLRCVECDGPLDIYRHGFVKASPGRKYLEYSDGTPFFYLGDTHWGMYTEEIDEPGPNVGAIKTDSHFKYIVDRRAEQGFTVYQSEPIGAAFNVVDGHVDAEDIPGFRLADRYYQYIAEAGLVHANAEFFFSSSMGTALANDDKALENLSRYWVARFGAFPVMWTLAQEIDNDFYHERGSNRVYDFTDNPWVKVAEYIHKHDAYGHPLSGHQENAWYTTVTGRGSGAEDRDANGASAFASEDVAQRTGHNWWAAQWSPSLTEPVDPELVRDYWESPRPAVNYEGRYRGLWTMDFGSRAQGWIAFLSGFRGYGYGAIDMWLYKSTYDIGSDSFDGVDHITVADKLKPWSEAIEYPSALQMRYLRSFLESFDWWNLVPELSDETGFEAEEGVAYARAKTSDIQVTYFYSRSVLTGELTGIQPDTNFSFSWYNPRTGEYGQEIQMTSGADGRLVLPPKPDTEDWVLKSVIKPVS